MALSLLKAKKGGCASDPERQMYRNVQAGGNDAAPHTHIPCRAWRNPDMIAWHNRNI
jgi:hypothetical protein